jgi:hypothetical protein
VRLARSFTSSGFAGSLLGSCHYVE